MVIYKMLFIRRVLELFIGIYNNIFVTVHKKRYLNYKETRKKLYENCTKNTLRKYPSSFKMGCITTIYCFMVL